MTSPFLRPEWSVEEAVLLVEASENIASSNGDVENEVITLSNRLRSGAISMGLTISNRYRSKEEVLNSLKVVNTMRKMIDSIEDDYFEGSVLGKVSLLFARNRQDYNSLLQAANEKYPVSRIGESIQEEVVILADAESEYKQTRRRRPRISEYRIEHYKDIKDNKNLNENEKISIVRFLPPEVPAEESKPILPIGVNIPNEIADNHAEEKLTNPKEDNVSTRVEGKTRPLSSYEQYLNCIRQVLIKNFPRGFRLGSAIEMKRFRLAYKSIHGKSMTFKDESLENIILSAGFEYDSKIYLPERVLPSHIAEEIESFINTVFYTKRRYVFFKHLYEQFKDLLLDTQIANPEMLRLYLKSLKRERWYVNDQFISSTRYVDVSIFDEVENYIKERRGIVTLDELKNALCYLPEEKVEHEWTSNNQLFISNGRNERFHIESFVITDKQLDEINTLISSALETAPFITADKLLEEVRLHTPDLFENNKILTNLGIRNALGTLLNKRYSFRNNLISKIENSYSGPDAMVAYCKSLGYYTLEDANAMAEIVGGKINFYLEKMSEVSIRINNKDFIPRESLQFDVAAIDQALDILFTGSFLSMASISSFEALPTCGDYPWTIYLLESYLLRSSAKFRYVHPTFLAQEDVTGAIVRADSPIKTYEDLLIQAIGESEITIDEGTCNEYLYEIGLIAKRRKNGPVKGLIAKAKECRNRIKQNKN